MFAVDAKKFIVLFGKCAIGLFALAVFVGCAQRPSYTVTQPLDRPAVDAVPTGEDSLNASARQYAKQVKAAQQVPPPPPSQPAPKAPDIEWAIMPESTPASASTPEAPVAAKLTPTQPLEPAPAVMPESSQSIYRIREREQMPLTAPFPEVTKTTVAPPAALTTQQLTQALLKNIDAEQKAGSAKTPLQIAALSLIDPSIEVTDEQLQHLSENERQLAIAYQMMFSELGMGLDGDAQATLDTLTSANDLLSEIIRDTKPLSIQNATLCTSVTGFGNFTPRSSNRFIPGPSNEVIVYLEIENFKPVMTTKGIYKVLLQLKSALITPDGVTVWNETLDIPDSSRNKRRDFYLPYPLKLNSNITLGSYILKLTITDLQGMHVDEVTLPIEYVAAKDLLTSSSSALPVATP